MLLLDVAPLSLGLEMHGGMMQKLIERNSTIPTNTSQDFTTAEDYQESVDIKVYEGERPMVADNNYLGKFTLKGIPKTLRGVPKIKVTFTIDSDGILTVTGEDQKNKLKGEVQIENEKGRLTQAEIERMLDEADKYKDQDKLTREETMARENLKSYLSRVRKTLEDFDDTKLPERDRKRIITKFNEMDDWLKKFGDRSPTEEIEDKLKELESAWNLMMIRVNQAINDFWDKQVALVEEKTISQGGFCVKTGFDLRELMDDPD